MPFTNEEAFDMLMVLGECQRNSSAAARVYAARYPDRERRSRHVFRNLAERLRRSGNVQPASSHRNERIARPVRDNRSPDVLAAVHVNPHTSIRQVARDSGVSATTVSRILKANTFHPYHMSVHQELHGTDFQSRLDFCMWAQAQMHANARFFDELVLWSDEATFKSDGQVNRHNMHYWAAVNPQWMQEVDHQRRWSVNVWCGIIDGRIIGPHFFEASLTGDVYRTFLQEQLPILLEDVPLHIRTHMWLQQDGCPAHFELTARNQVNAMFRDRWVGRGGPVPWPPRSPDLTCLDYYLWGRIKDIVYQHRPTTRDNMMERIVAACRQISEEEIIAAQNHFSYRVQKCIEAQGRHFEHLL